MFAEATVHAEKFYLQLSIGLQNEIAKRNCSCNEEARYRVTRKIIKFFKLRRIEVLSEGVDCEQSSCVRIMSIRLPRASDGGNNALFIGDLRCCWFAYQACSYFMKFSLMILQYVSQNYKLFLKKIVYNPKICIEERAKKISGRCWREAIHCSGELVLAVINNKESVKLSCLRLQKARSQAISYNFGIPIKISTTVVSSCRTGEKHSLRRIIVKVVEHSLTKQCLKKSQQSHREIQSNLARSRRTTSKTVPSLLMSLENLKKTKLFVTSHKRREYLQMKILDRITDKRYGKIKRLGSLKVGRWDYRQKYIRCSKALIILQYNLYRFYE
ncbi:hypothetical protein WN51_07658 [Melipona quadrifasciata]|uniref:Uncharacterized protein n=1 Tax=Melipona quadrifasciata TaxID=166423 RepID=A0A0M8ZNF8_9HYME|nr:hypothetical protein WN51_07658 [Melipona quadrifasciata]